MERGGGFLHRTHSFVFFFFCVCFDTTIVFAKNNIMCMSYIVRHLSGSGTGFDFP